MTRATLPTNSSVTEQEGNTMRNASTAPLVGALIGAVATAALVIATPADAKTWREPYGGCVEGHRYVHSQGARECRAHGWIVRPRVVVDPHGHVRFNTLPACYTEDGSFIRGGKVRYQRHCYYDEDVFGSDPRARDYILDRANGRLTITWVKG